MSGLQELLACPVCCGGLAWVPDEARCRECGAAYPIEDGIPIFVADGGGQKRRQAEWFDDTGDPEWEIVRPFGGPALHRFLLEEKFRRGTVAISALIPGSTVLTVCGGSGMDASFLSELGAGTVVSSDISVGAARRARERGHRFGARIIPLVADVEHLPFPDRSIDLVYVHDGLHHLERPLDGLSEMARVARRAVCVTEPARAAVTGLAVRLGFALEQEEAGNRVARLTLDNVRSTLAAAGLRVLTAERYGMYYRHDPGWAVRSLSHQPFLSLAKVSFTLVNALAGQFGNKLTVQGVREPA